MNQLDQMKKSFISNNAFNHKPSVVDFSVKEYEESKMTSRNKDRGQSEMRSVASKKKYDIKNMI